MSVRALPASRAADPVTQARIQLAAAHRLAVMHELEEGIDNHFTVTLPGRDDQYLTLPFGLHWSEARASDMIVFDESGATLEGEGVVEPSAQCIHAPIHRITGRWAPAGRCRSSPTRSWRGCSRPRPTTGIRAPSASASISRR